MTPKQVMSSTAPWWPAVVIAACALIFTVVSFWWLNVRRGRLIAYQPLSFACMYSKQIFLLRLPLVIHNTGPTPIVIRNLRASLKSPVAGRLLVFWRTTRNQISPTEDDEPLLPAAFAVNGRSANQFFFEFGLQPPTIEVEAASTTVVVEALLGHSDDWRSITTFTLHVEHVADPSHYVAYSNSSAEVTTEDRQKAAVAFEAVSRS